MVDMLRALTAPSALSAQTTTLPQGVARARSTTGAPVVGNKRHKEAEKP
eukprot:COSAG01_NODE_2620_length_7364_cov_25.110805_2_plen_49_part_00